MSQRPGNLASNDVITALKAFAADGGNLLLTNHAPNDLKDVTPEERETIDKMIEKLEDFDDVQTVYTNMKPEGIDE